MYYKLLVAFSVLVVGYGLLSLSEATLGVGLIAIGCFLGIIARITQAGEYRRGINVRKSTE